MKSILNDIRSGWLPTSEWKSFAAYMMRQFSWLCILIVFAAAIAIWLLISLACTVPISTITPPATTETSAPTATVIYPTLNPTVKATYRTPEPTVTATPALTNTKQTWVTVSTGIANGVLNVRSLPNDQSVILTNLREGDKVIVTGSPTGGWLPIHTGNMNGYIAVKFTNYYK
jgi:uncharacterized protein YgiM (DUF1202 family)